MNIFVDRHLRTLPVVVDKLFPRRIRVVRKPLLPAGEHTVSIVQNDPVREVSQVFLHVTRPLEFVTPNESNQQIADVVFSNEKNYVTDPIRVPNGFLILQVLDHHKAGLAQLEEVENEIMEELYGPLFDPALREFLTKLRQQAFLQIRDGYVDSAAAPGKDTTWQDPAQLKPETVTKEEVLTKTRRRRLLWLIPIPWTETTVKAKSKSGS